MTPATAADTGSATVKPHLSGAQGAGEVGSSAAGEPEALGALPDP
eukprot:CAMPEP_0183442598 /NCGR_PEP_ID=MMETSP0370-20130417/88789_1 /TAXON_ID=268820 /ORGANISM="Peridinium aciculiferum, Strain PAER-2" /LENGTH=44 /DNA_ID= /DNA_START= /DNA_END= /DNA_ORIENTATION=